MPGGELPHTFLPAEAELPRIGQLVGPHGSGKSTLAYALAKSALSNDLIAGFQAAVLDGRRIRYQLGEGVTTNPAACLLIVDGIETWSWLNRMLLFRSTRNAFQHVCLTVHRRIFGVPLLAKLEPSLNHFLKIVEGLQADREIQLDRPVVTQAYRECNANYRQALMRLYDESERIRADQTLNHESRGAKRIV